MRSSDTPSLVTSTCSWADATPGKAMKATRRNAARRFIRDKTLNLTERPEPRLPESQLQFRCLGHHLLCPRRIPDNLDFRVDDTRHRKRLVTYFDRQTLRSWTRRRGQRHPYADPAVLVDQHIVDEAHLLDIDRDLGVEHGAQGLHHLRADVGHLHRIRNDVLDRLAQFVCGTFLWRWGNV